jgi:hypothetical protein
MSTAGFVILIIIIVLVIVALAVGAWRITRRRALHRRFGPEYDRVAAEQPSRGAAEHELRGRERKHAELELRPLTPDARARYAAEWADVQVRFVDSPSDVVQDCDALVTRLITDMGYPADGEDERLAMLSVEYAGTLGRYRDAHEISLANARGEASTEQLRQALVHYRTLFAELLGEQPDPQSGEPIPTESVESGQIGDGANTNSVHDTRTP